MRHGSLFSGIGGFDLAAEWMGWENVFQVEKDSFCQKVLEKNFPQTKRYGDIKEFDGTKYRGAVDIISGGFPCQPFSEAGKRKGKEDDRFLWPEMLRVIREIRPAFVVCENVNGIISLGLGDVLTSLEDTGYITETFVIPACGVGAQHRRDRVWIIAYQDSQSDKSLNGNSRSRKLGSNHVPFTEYERCEEQRFTGKFQSDPVVPNGRWGDKSGFRGGTYGVPNRVDRIKSLGNAIVPQVAYEIFKAIEIVNKEYFECGEKRLSS